MPENITPLIAGNWKMNGTAAALAEIEALREGVEDIPELRCEILICPPATLISRMAEKARGSAVQVGGQDCHSQKSGAHTGDISAEMLADAGASHVILGHSERRTDHGETDAIVRAKALAALGSDLVPIICVGETEAERLAGEALAVVERQLAASIPDEAGPRTFVVAYEPVWAIGTGRTPTTDDISQMHGAMRKLLERRFGEAGSRVPLLYGGSMKPGNAAEILAIGDVNGGLVGGASLKAADFLGIIAAA